MSGVATAIGGGALLSAVVSSSNAGKAADAQTAAAQQGIDAQNAQFQQISQWLQPYRDAGPGALNAQQNLAGLNGNSAQASAIAAIQNSPAFTSQLAQGENSIRQNASATGNLRGGNIQAALAQFSPSLLAQTINQQYSQLGGLTTMGAQAALQNGQFGQTTANNTANLLGQAGNATANGYLASGQAVNGAINGIGSGLGYYLSRPAGGATGYTPTYTPGTSPYGTPQGINYGDAAY